MTDILYDHADKTNPYRFEDIYYTGIVPIVSPSNILLVNIKKFLHWERDWTMAEVYKKLISIGNPDFTKSTFTTTWLNLLKHYVFKK